jgi:hypothetical protein
MNTIQRLRRVPLLRLRLAPIEPYLCRKQSAQLSKARLGSHFGGHPVAKRQNLNHFQNNVDNFNGQNNLTYYELIIFSSDLNEANWHVSIFPQQVFAL